MTWLFHNITLIIVFIFWIYLCIRYFSKESDIYRKILIIQCALVMLLAIDYLWLHSITENNLANKYVLPILIISMMLTMYISDFKEYKKNKNEQNLRELKTTALKYALVIIFYAFLCWHAWFVGKLMSGIGWNSGVSIGNCLAFNMIIWTL